MFEHAGPVSSVCVNTCGGEREGEAWSTCACWCVCDCMRMCAALFLREYVCVYVCVCVCVYTCVCVFLSKRHKIGYRAMNSYMYLSIYVTLAHALTLSPKRSSQTYQHNTPKHHYTTH